MKILGLIWGGKYELCSWVDLFINKIRTEIEKKIYFINFPAILLELLNGIGTLFMINFYFY